MPLAQVHDAGNPLVTPLGHDVGGAEITGEPLPLLVPAHCNDPLGAHLLGRENAEQADRAIPDDRDG